MIDATLTTLAMTTMTSPVGELSLYASETGLRAILWPPEIGNRVTPGEAGRRRSQVLDTAVRQLGEYFAGDRKTFDVPLDPVGSPFQLDVWMILRAIPYGETITYGEQARRLGDPNKSRAVGTANGRNPLSIIVPCHRVIGANGKLVGFGGGLDNKAWLLHHEQDGRLAL